MKKALDTVVSVISQRDQCRCHLMITILCYIEYFDKKPWNLSNFLQYNLFIIGNNPCVNLKRTVITLYSICAMINMLFVLSRRHSHINTFFKWRGEQLFETDTCISSYRNPKMNGKSYRTKTKSLMIQKWWLS